MSEPFKPAPCGADFFSPAMRSLVAQTDALWGKGATIPVMFLDRNALFEDHVATHLKLWEAACDVHFALGRPGGVKVTFRMTNSFWSLIGKEAVNQPGVTMSLGFRGDEPDSEFRRLILHEFGHVLSFFHEHTSPVANIPWVPDAQLVQVYRRFFPGLPGEQILQQLKALQPSTRLMWTPYDPLSVMHYMIPEDAILPGQYRPEFGRNNTELSPSDISLAAQLYGPGTGREKPPPIPTGGDSDAREITVGGPPLAGEITSDGQVDQYVFRVSDSRPRIYDITTAGTAIVHVALADANFANPDEGGDSISVRFGATLYRILRAGTYSLLVSPSKFDPQTRGRYTIRVGAEI